MNEQVRKITLPNELCVAVEQRFGNLEAFLTFVMTELLRDNASAQDRNEERLIEERLRDLGYM